MKQAFRRSTVLIYLGNISLGHYSHKTPYAFFPLFILFPFTSVITAYTKGKVRNNSTKYDTDKLTDDILGFLYV